MTARCSRVRSLAVVCASLASLLALPARGQTTAPPTGTGASTTAPSAFRAQVVTAMRAAATFYARDVASHGGYVYYYALDLGRRWGEGEATPAQIWVQPPGTPTVGMAFLAAYDATGDRFYLDAATAAAEALVYGQLESGGWTACVDFDGAGARVARYRDGRGRGKNNSTLDDGITQAAIRFLARADRALGFAHARIHDAARRAIDALLAAQFPNGAFPQVWTGPSPKRPVVPARLPAYDWRTEGRVKNYWELYTLNDGVAPNVVRALVEAGGIYEDARCEAALRALGDFLLLAQLPEPQPAWAQQYTVEMCPAWARAFEPPAVTGSESQGVMETLLEICRRTGDMRYLEPLPRAIAYLRRSLLPDGRLARYYELATNRPLYMVRRDDTYALTYDDTDLPSHYSWRISSHLDAIERALVALKSAKMTGPRTPAPDVGKLEREARRIVAELDARHRWVSADTGQSLVGQPKFAAGTQFLASEVFSRNLEALSAYLAATRPAQE